MKKFLIAGMAARHACHPAAASADVPRCEASVPTSTTVTTATFTALQPKDTEHQFTNVWKHDFTVIVNADGTFSGTGTTTDNGGSFAWAESITGSFNADRRASASRPSLRWRRDVQGDGRSVQRRG